MAGTEFVGVLQLFLLVASARTRRIVWRNTVYEMVSPDQTIILERSGDKKRAVPQDSP